jgi:YidC/Oxa1 family membrane protein insertase
MEPQTDQRNLLLAMVLMFGVFFLYWTFILQPQEKARREAVARSQAEQAQIVQNPSVAVAAALLPRADVVAADLRDGKRVPLDAPGVDGSISLVGARIDDVGLKNFYETVADKKAHRTEAEIRLFSPERTERAFYGEVVWKTDTSSTEGILWTQTSTGPLTHENPLKLSVVLTGAKIDRTIAVDNDYMFIVTDVFQNTGAAPLSVTPEARLRQRSLTELLKPLPQAHAGSIGVFNEQRNQMRSYADLDKGKPVGESINKGWIGLTTKYWMGALVPEQGDPVTVAATAERENGQVIFQARYTSSKYTIAPGQSVTKTARIFAGAKRVAVLDSYEKTGQVPNFTDAVDWSWIWFITKPFFWLLMIFQNWFGSFGWAILALTVVVKTAFMPLQYRMYASMSRMRKLQPQIEQLKERFAADKQRQQQEMMKLYQQEKVNPLAGCLPLIPQMFVFWSLYHTLYVTIEMRHTPFYGWIQDMSAPDPTSIFNLFGLIPWNPASVPLIGGILMIGAWPILYGLTMFGNQSLSPQPTDPTQKMIMRWMPVLFLFFFAYSPAGLVIYWTWSGLISVVQQYFIMRSQGVETEFDKLIKKRFGKKTAA